MQNKEKEGILVHYAEIGLKGKNRNFFEDTLVFNIQNALPEAQVIKKRGRVVVIPGNKNHAIEVLKRVCGIAYFSPALIIPSSLEVIEKRVPEIVEELSFETFRVTVKRSDKRFSISSGELAGRLGERIQNRMKKDVDLENPELNCHVEITPEETYVYFSKIKGVGGLPVGTSGKVAALLSGGIDSPVASFRMMKRGMKNIFIHFHAYPSTSKESIKKTEEVVKTLSSFQGGAVLYLVPFDEVQKEIMLNTREKFRVLLYRRFMVSIGSRIAEKEKARALVTGESLGQVASQTIENMTVTDDGSELPVLRPLLGYDKEEIIKEAKGLGTYETSILPEEDCCVRFLPKNPETRGSVPEIRKEEENLEKERMIKKAIESSERKIM